MIAMSRYRLHAWISQYLKYCHLFKRGISEFALRMAFLVGKLNDQFTKDHIENHHCRVVKHECECERQSLNCICFHFSDRFKPLGNLRRAENSPNVSQTDRQQKQTKKTLLPHSFIVLQTLVTPS